MELLIIPASHSCRTELILVKYVDRLILVEYTVGTYLAIRKYYPNFVGADIYIIFKVKQCDIYFM